MISISSKNQVILLPILSEVFLSIVNDMVSTERARQVQISRAAYSCDLGSKRFGDLYCKRPHTARCSIDQNFLPCLNLSVIAKALQGDYGRFRYSRCFLERQIGRF